MFPDTPRAQLHNRQLAHLAPAFFVSVLTALLYGFIVVPLFETISDPPMLPLLGFLTPAAGLAVIAGLTVFVVWNYVHNDGHYGNAAVTAYVVFILITMGARQPVDPYAAVLYATVVAGAVFVPGIARYVWRTYLLYQFSHKHE